MGSYRENMPRSTAYVKHRQFSYSFDSLYRRNNRRMSSIFSATSLIWMHLPLWEKTHPRDWLVVADSELEDCQWVLCVALLDMGFDYRCIFVGHSLFRWCNVSLIGYHRNYHWRTWNFGNHMLGIWLYFTLWQTNLEVENRVLKNWVLTCSWSFTRVLSMLVQISWQGTTRITAQPQRCVFKPAG